MPFDPDIPAARVAGFVRQHTHDVRNGLNGLDLEAALLLEIVTDAEARESVTRIREQLRKLAEELRVLAARFHQPKPHLAPLAVRDLLLIFREQSANLSAPLEIVWQDELGDANADVDAMMMAEIFRELLVNAATFPAQGPIAIRAYGEGKGVVFEITEPKGEMPLDLNDWGDVPFSSTRRGRYGLGLWAARRLAEANDVELTRESLSSGALVTRLRLGTK